MTDLSPTSVWCLASFSLAVLLSPCATGWVSPFPVLLLFLPHGLPFCVATAQVQQHRHLLASLVSPAKLAAQSVTEHCHLLPPENPDLGAIRRHATHLQSEGAALYAILIG
ncbi:hypothetical protein F4824DRAFT_166427 [Ustulina deusta]|nr:hypothetical protein F4824DRAFT_166427 [Ustulina deusta]